MSAPSRQRSESATRSDSPEKSTRSWRRQLLIYIALTLLALPIAVPAGAFTALETELVPNGRAINDYIGDYLKTYSLVMVP